MKACLEMPLSEMFATAKWWKERKLGAVREGSSSETLGGLEAKK